MAIATVAISFYTILPMQLLFWQRGNRDNRGDVRFAHAIIKRFYLGIENLLQVLKLHVDASYEVVEEFVLLAC
ncbi:MAG TPA: hypothetical protein VJ761_10915, partial [Ktedonobacteraceae bacterium]|nr:hypothetical protein [Ktedonobacteraceae bacterium]